MAHRTSRRDFLELKAASAMAMTFAPFVESGRYLPNPSGEAPEGKSKVLLGNGSQSSVHTFPAKHAEVVVYPESDDPVLNKQAFRTWQFMHLLKEMSGEKGDASAFMMYCMVCLHLWCLWKDFPRKPDLKDMGRMVGGNGQCPCHGALYKVFTGEAYLGPASIQGPLTSSLGLNSR